MYGQIHCVTKELVLEQYGEKIWQIILKKCGMDDYEHFQVFTRYADSLTFKLFPAVSETLNLPMDEVLKKFGTHFLTYCLRHGYDRMLRSMGSDLFIFIQNLDSLHALLAFTYKGIKAPSFRCEQGDGGDLLLHYYTQKDGFFPVVIGLVEAVGKELFKQTAKVTAISQAREEVAAGIKQYHSIFRVVIEGDSHRELDDSLLLSPDATSPLAQLSRRTAPDGKEESSDDKDCPIKADDFCLAFPYHILFDNNLDIQQCGENIRRITRIPIKYGMHFNRIGDIMQPVINQTIENICKFINAVFVLAIYRKAGEHNHPFILKGQMIWLEGTQMMIFIGSPRITSLTELIDMKMYLSDIPIYDTTRELVLLNQQRIAEIDVAKKLDETTAELQKTSADLENEKRKTEDLLHMMLPKKVADTLTQGVAVRAEKFDCVTIAFSDIVTFTNIASACSPMAIVNMLNELYNRFDNLTNIHEVYKVETIGDAYMTVAGVPEVQEDHSERIADFAMDIAEIAGHVNSPATGLPLQIRVGIHSGPVVAGVVGKKMPRYCLFGDTVNTTSRMESNSVPGRIHVSSIVQANLSQYGYVFKRRGEIEVKGKGKMITFFLVGKLTRRIKEPDDEFITLVEDICPKPIVRPVSFMEHRPSARQKSFNFFKKHSLRPGGSPTTTTGESSRKDESTRQGNLKGTSTGERDLKSRKCVVQ